MAVVGSAVGDVVDDVVRSAGYAGLAGLIFVENVFPPIPSELILPLAGFYVGQGEFVYLLAVAAATLGSVLGALLLYVIARRGGRPLMLKYGPKVRLSERDLDKADHWFDRHGAWIVLFGRLIPGVRSLVSIPAGLSEMPVAKFIALTAVGSAVWNAALIGAGWALGDNWGQIEDLIAPWSKPIVGTLIVVLGAWLIVVLRRRRRVAPAA